MLSALLQDPHRQKEYAYLDILEDKISVYYTKKGKINKYEFLVDTPSSTVAIRKKLGEIFRKENIAATGFLENKSVNKITPKLWLEDDVVSLKFTNNSNKTNVSESLKFVYSSFDKNAIANIKINKENEVEVTDLISLSYYKKIVPPQTFDELISLSEKFRGKKISFINSTPQGGGVAIMRHSLMRLFKLLNVDAHWYILKPDLSVFNITKRKFHNVLQGVSNARLTDRDKKIYNSWIFENAKNLENVFKTSDVIVIDDPQPSGLIPYIKRINSKIKVVYRSHIQIETKLIEKDKSAQKETWEFLWNNIKSSDCFVSHPVLDFVPKEIPPQKVVFMPATTDPLDGLNKNLTKSQMKYYLEIFNRFLKEENQSPLDFKRPYIIQIARFDPSKGIPFVLQAYDKLYEKLKKYKQKIPQLVITGNGSVDDPDRMVIYESTMKIINSKEFAKIRKYIKVTPLPHIDQLLNALLRKSRIALQLSTKEGFEIKVTEALMKGKPVVAFETGGIPLQIKNKINGFLVPVGNTDLVCEYLFNLLTDKELYERMKSNAENLYDHSFLTIPNAIRWLELSLKLLRATTSSSGT